MKRSWKRYPLILFILEWEKEQELFVQNIHLHWIQKISTEQNMMDVSMDKVDEVDHQDADTSQVLCDSSHTTRNERVAEKWASLRPRIRKRMVEKNCLQDDCLCCSCGQSASVKCFECGSLFFYCPGCCINAHRTFLFSHQPLVWNANVSRQSLPH